MLDQEQLLIFHHVFLPPKVPQSSDNDYEARALLPRLRAAVHRFSREVEPQHRHNWERIKMNITKWIQVYADGASCETDIKDAVASMQEGHILLFYIKCQNAALILRKTATATMFETFEVQPNTEAVLAAQGALCRSFPAKSCSVPSEKMQDPTFIDQLALYIHRLSVEQIAQSMEKSTKGHAELVEDRQSENPLLVTNWLLTVLASVGEPSTSTLVINKRTHDEICFKDAAKPWRRSAIWLCFKVALQITTLHLFPKDGSLQYKNFMLFFLSALADTIVETQKASLDELHVIRVKLANRYKKLDTQSQGFVVHSPLDCIERIKKQMDDKWRTVIEHERSQIPKIEIQNPLRSFVLDRTFAGLKEIWTNTQRLSSNTISESILTVSHRHAHSSVSIPDFSKTYSAECDGLFSLLALENWVADCLPSWNVAAGTEHNDCEKIRNLISEYLRAARVFYHGLPERMSIMLLSIMELWVALDQLSIQLLPLLEEYSPEIPVNVFAPLILPKKDQVDRLAQVQSYLAQRTNKCKISGSSVFGAIDQDSFGVRYFDSSIALQKLKRDIEIQAYSDREAHRLLFEERCELQQKLLIEWRQSVCENFTLTWGDRAGQEVHSRNCSRCAMKRAASQITIGKHEWPLPAYVNMAKTAVFELQPSMVFVWWREAVLMLRNDILLAFVKPAHDTKGYLHHFAALQGSARSIPRRVVLASAVKSMNNTHYNVQKLDLDSIFVAHCMQYHFYDDQEKGWLEEQTEERSFSRFCQTQPGLTASLVSPKAINQTTHGQNKVIAEQSKCPPELSPHEYVTISSLRSGGRLQWMNLLSSLLSNQVNFNNTTVVSIVEQMAHQIGPYEESRTAQVFHDYHTELFEPRFVEALIDVMNSKLNTIKSNWQETETAAVLLIIAHRLLSLSNSHLHKSRAIQMIREVRVVTLQWLRRMKGLSDNVQDADQSLITQTSADQRMLSAALVARATWDVEKAYFTKLLENPTDIGDFMECSICIHDLSARHEGHQSPELQRRLRYDNILAAKLENQLVSMIESHNDDVSHGIRRLVPNLEFNHLWQAVVGNDGAWFVNTAGRTQIQIQLNLLSGKLLVDGKPLHQLPEVYLSDLTYKAIFGDRTLSVIASNVPGMDYRVTMCFNEHVVYLAYRDSKVSIRSEVQGQFYEAIPRSVFKDDILPLLIKDTIAWMNLDTAHIVFRNKPWDWQPHTPPLTLVFNAQSQTGSTLKQDLNAYINDRSVTGNMISRAFVYFERSIYLHMAFNMDTGNIDVSLPRYRLSFEVNKDGLLYCHELSSTVSPCQSIGTLYGLRTRLLLETVGNLHSYSKEMVLIPYGTVSIEEQTPHVNVCVDPGDSIVVQYFRFTIDTQLGQLVSDNNLEAHVFKTYLHAITSSPLADNLTSRTGTAESLRGLANKLSWTTVPLTEQAQSILDLVACLTPNRSFYPAHLKYMQQIQWHSSLSSLSQHGQFFMAVEKIIRYNKRASMLFDNPTITVLQYAGDVALLQRSQFQMSKYYVKEGSTQPKINDELYASRDRTIYQSSQHAYSMSTLIGRWPDTLPIQVMIHEMLACQDCLSGFQEAFSAVKMVDLLNVDISASWPSLFSLCQRATSHEREKLRFEFSLMIFGNPATKAYLTTLLAFAICSQLKVMSPSKDNYALDFGHTMDWTIIDTAIEECGVHPDSKYLVEAKVAQAMPGVKWKSERLNRSDKKGRKAYFDHIECQKTEVETAIRDCWPSGEVTIPSATGSETFDRPRLKEVLDPHFNNWFVNYQLYECCHQYDRILKTVQAETHHPRVPDLNPAWTDQRQSGNRSIRPSLLVLMQHTPFLNSSTMMLATRLRNEGLDSKLNSLLLKRLRITSVEDGVKVECEVKVEQIVQKLQQSADGVSQDYSKSLTRSLSAVKRNYRKHDGGRFMDLDNRIVSRIHIQAQREIQHVVQIIRRLIEPTIDSERALQKAGMWPEVTQLALLRLLCHKHRDELPDMWRSLLVGFAQAITALQRAERIKRYIDAGDEFALHRELANEAHGTTWDVSEHVDWLLLEVQNDMLIRPVQVRVAVEIMKNGNGSLMLGMGEGKTSVILPMAITEMTNSGKLLRVVVPKSLANEMLRTLSYSLAGLVDRAVYYLPFSRHTRITSEAARALQKLYEDCKTSQGVLLTLPEHLNSFRLVGIDRLSSTTGHVLAEQLLGIQKWLDTHSRDVMDECDEVLKPAYELVYTNGEAKLLQGAPNRWSITLSLLSLLKDRVTHIKSAMPDSIEIEDRCRGSYPKIRILDNEAFDYLAKILVADIVQGRLPGVPATHHAPGIEEALGKFILKYRISRVVMSTVTAHFQDASVLDNLYLLRGLMAYGVLLSALSKRWHVNYGLDRGRCLSAVPYRAKATPTPAAEFAQPETMVLLTTLSFYYTGLTLKDVRACLVHLHKVPDPAHEYTQWIAESQVPPELQSLSSVNIEDSSHAGCLHEHLFINTALINFFLNHLVFPKEAKEFPNKLGTSAWDLCSDDSTKFTSGFSGTGDSILPLSMPQRPVPDLEHTAASIMCTLLRPENQRYVCSKQPDGVRLSPSDLLASFVWQDENLSVIIDVGAQFLEANDSIASQWLRGRRDKQAVVFFDEHDRKLVLDRAGRKETWTSSPFRDQTHDCLFFLDEFHTRGTDFHFPDHYGGAVLLGPNLQKDTCVQACMRMRKLGFTQYVVFFAPPEVDNSIRALVAADADDILTSYHVLLWTIHNSCAARRSQRGLWLIRGLAHAQRKHAFSQYVAPSGVVRNPEHYLQKLREVESRPLSEMYSASSERKALSYNFSTEDLKDRNTSRLLKQWHAVDAEVLVDRNYEEEQEREILHEVEQEREVQRPQAVTPCKAVVDETLWAAIRGDANAAAMIKTQSCFEIIKKTSLARELFSRDLPTHVRATQGFNDTIIQNNKAPVDDFLRPVRWVLQIKGKKDIFLISPYEANTFLPALRVSNTAVLFLYSARTLRTMTSFDELDVYCVPENPLDIKPSSEALTALRLFAGQLYFNCSAEYDSFCDVLGLWNGKRNLEEDGREVGADLFVSPDCRMLDGWKCTFETSPVIRIRKWINMRRHGIDWTHTHVGRVLNGQMLRDSDFN